MPIGLAPNGLESPAANGLRFMLARKAKKALEGGHRRSTAVEAKLELTEIDLQILGTYPMMSALEPRLQIREDTMDPREDVSGVALLVDLRLVVVSERGKRCVARQAVREHSCTVSDIATNECCERGLRGGRNDAKTEASRSFAADLNCANNKHFASGSSAAFARARSAYETLVHLNQTSDPIPSGPQHGPPQSMQHSPSCLIGAHTELSLQLDRRQSRRHSADQIGSMEPQLKRYASTMQNGPRRRRCLPAASFALPQSPLRERVCLDAPTIWTRESVGPPRLRQVAGA